MGRAWLTLIAGLSLAGFAAADEPAKKYQIVTPKDDAIVATAINAGGEIVGFEWVEEKKHPGIVVQMPFYAKGKEITYLPLLAGYTATFPADLSDEGLVVGRASKPAPPGVIVPLRNQGFIWDAKTGIRGLGVLKDDSASFACGITSDGRRISGFSVGPNRMRACIWEKYGDVWRANPMPHEFQLGSNTVAMSDNGKFLTAMDGELPCLWSEDAAGGWSREVIAGKGVLVPRAVNNSGTVVGLRFTGDGLTHAMLRTRKGSAQEIKEPEGYLRSEASAINNEGVVVGMVDGPNGSKTGPRPFVYENGRVRLMDEGGPAFTAATAINDHGQVSGVMEKEDEPDPASPQRLASPPPSIRGPELQSRDK